MQASSFVAYILGYTCLLCIVGSLDMFFCSKMLRRTTRKRKPTARQDEVAPAARREAVSQARKATPPTQPTPVRTVIPPPTHTTTTPARTVIPPTSTSSAAPLAVVSTVSSTSGSDGPSIDPAASTTLHTGSIVTDQPILISKASDDMGCNVPQTIKQKIIAGEYIDLALLLTNSQSSTDTHKITFVQGELLVQPKQQQQKITSIELWTDAFITYMSIYCKTHSEAYADLLKYMSTIRLGAKRSSAGWKLYDEQFRLRQSHDPSNSWAVIDAELWLIYMNSSLTPSTGTGLVNRVQKCYAYNYNGVCGRQVCHYSHSCIRCFGPHPIKFCSGSNARGVQVDNVSRPLLRTPAPTRGAFGRGARFNNFSQYRPRY